MLRSARPRIARRPELEDLLQRLKNSFQASKNRSRFSKTIRSIARNSEAENRPDDAKVTVPARISPFSSPAEREHVAGPHPRVGRKRSEMGRFGRPLAAANPT